MVSAHSGGGNSDRTADRDRPAERGRRDGAGGAQRGARKNAAVPTTRSAWGTLTPVIALAASVLFAILQIRAPDGLTAACNAWNGAWIGSVVCGRLPQAQRPAGRPAGEASSTGAPGEGGRLLLPAAGGEALDKLSILDIKLRRIRDARKLANVRRERDALLERLPPGFQDGAMADIYRRLVEARPRPLRVARAAPGPSLFGAAPRSARTRRASPASTPCRSTSSSGTSRMACAPARPEGSRRPPARDLIQPVRPGRDLMHPLVLGGRDSARWRFVT